MIVNHFIDKGHASQTLGTLQNEIWSRQVVTRVQWSPRETIYIYSLVVRTDGLKTVYVMTIRNF